MGETDQKFMFDMNVFDDGHIEEEEDLPPPPPTFSEAELEQAKKHAFSQGEAKATKDITESLQQSVANTITSISSEISVLFEEEVARKKLYEQEALNLTLHLFQTLFPHYQKAIGFDELKSFLTDTFVKNRQPDTVSVKVAPELKEGVNEAMQTITAQHPDMKFEVSGDEAFKGTACRLSWNEGGATFNPVSIAQEVEAILKQTLEDDGHKSHDDIPHDENQTHEQKNDIVEENNLDALNEDVTEDKPNE